jgi:hypothetical protein
MMVRIQKTTIINEISLWIMYFLKPHIMSPKPGFFYLEIGY